MNTQDQLRRLEKKKARLAKIEKRLLEQAQAEKQKAGQLGDIVRASGMAPRDLVFALVTHYGVRLAGRRKGSGGKRRKRTKITAELRDAIKKTVKGGASMNATSKKFDISYAVVMKMVKGLYDKLK